MRVRGSAALLLAALAACGESVSPGNGAPALSVLSGDNQEGNAADTLSDSLRVLVQDAAGKPLAGRVVTWSALSEGGRVEPATDTTDAHGVASARWRLDVTPGIQSVRADYAGGDPVSFHATARSGFKAVALMHGEPGEHMCAIDVDRHAWCWGRNDFGQIGTGTSGDPVLAPTAVVGSHAFTSLTGGYLNSCGLDLDGYAWCWGRNQGVFGNGGTEDSPVPVAAGGGLQFATLDVSWDMACGLSTDGRAYCWGRGVPGDGQPVQTSLTPLEIAGGGTWRAVDVGNGYACAITMDGVTWCWGSNFTPFGSETPSATPVQIGFVPPLASLSASLWNPCGFRADASATPVCWGGLFFGAVDTATAFGDQAFVNLWTTASGTLAIASDGAAWIRGESPYWFDAQFYTTTRLGPYRPWRELSASGRGIYGILAADSSLFEIRLSLDADPAGFSSSVQPTLIPASP